MATSTGTVPATNRRIQSSRRSAIINGVVAAVIVVALLTVALVAQPPSPPSIAEFAPQAQQQIEEAPSSQSVTGGAAAEPAQETIVIEDEVPEVADEVPQETKTEEAIVGVPSSLSCVTWPDGSVTQTFDPQSPPCIASWPERDQGNGGATARGVTETEILVAVPWGTPEEYDFNRIYDNLVEHFNSSYQFYGRKIRMVRADSASSGSYPEEARAWAIDLAALEPFAALDNAGGGGASGEVESLPIFRRTLVEQGVVTMMDLSSTLTTSELEASNDLLWSYAPPMDVLLRHTVEFVCGSLTGHNAEYAGGASRTLPRKFAVLVGQNPLDPGGELTDTTALTDGMATCGVDAPVHVYDPADATGQQALMVQLQSDQVTTLIMASYGGQQAGLRSYATQSGYLPEWLQVGTVGQHEDSYWEGNFLTPSTTGINETFGIASTNTYIPVHAEPAYQAATQGGLDPSKTGSIRRTAIYAYRMLLMLSAGIQAAGPNLTPETLAAALHDLQFANPGAGKSPYYQASVDLRSDNFMVQDVGVFWYSPTATNKRYGDKGYGGYCYLDNGVRFRLDNWRRDIQLFNTVC